MKIEPGCIVSLKVKMYDAQGNLLEASDDPLVYLHGAADIFPAIEQALEGREPGEKTSVHLEPEQAFGDYNAELVTIVPRKQLGEKVEVGLRYEGIPGQASDGRTYTVTDLTNDVAVLDGNHALAGMALRFDLDVLAVDKATEQELAEADAPAVPEFLKPVAGHDVHGSSGQKH